MTKEGLAATREAPTVQEKDKPVAWRWKLYWDQEKWNWSDTEPNFSPHDLREFVIDLQPLYARGNK